MGKSGLTNECMMQNMMRNPQQMIQKVNNSINPQLLQTIGGAENMMNMLKQVKIDQHYLVQSNGWTG